MPIEFKKIILESVAILVKSPAEYANYKVLYSGSDLRNLHYTWQPTIYCTVSQQTFSSKITRRATLAAIGFAFVIFCHLLFIDANSGVCRNCMPLFSCLPKNRGCPFCDPTQLERIVYEDDEILVFFDRKPAARTHLLAVPKIHIPTVKDLKAKHAELLKHMLSTGHELLKDYGYTQDQIRLGFHVPPFNSVHHLHLHCLGLPFVNMLIGIKYTEMAPWYMDGERLYEQLTQK